MSGKPLPDELSRRAGVLRLQLYVVHSKHWIGNSARGGMVRSKPQKTPLIFPTARQVAREPVSAECPMGQADVYRMIRRRALDAGIETKIGCHSFRATGITEYLRNGGKLEVAQQMANHESARTTGLYDRRNDQVSLDEVERILI